MKMRKFTLMHSYIQGWRKILSQIKGESGTIFDKAMKRCTYNCQLTLSTPQLTMALQWNFPIYKVVNLLYMEQVLLKITTVKEIKLSSFNEDPIFFFLSLASNCDASSLFFLKILNYCSSQCFPIAFTSFKVPTRLHFSLAPAFTTSRVVTWNMLLNPSQTVCGSGSSTNSE